MLMMTSRSSIMSAQWHDDRVWSDLGEQGEDCTGDDEDEDDDDDESSMPSSLTVISVLSNPVLVEISY